MNRTDHPCSLTEGGNLATDELGIPRGEVVNQPGDSATCGGIRNRQDKVPHFRHARSVGEAEETGRLPVAGQSPHVFGGMAPAILPSSPET